MQTQLFDVAYDSDSATLCVEFQTGAMYEYYGVPAPIANELMMTSARFTYYNSNIRNNYLCQKFPAVPVHKLNFIEAA